MTRQDARINQAVFAAALGGQLVLLWLSRELPFFWDSIQFGSRHATFLWQSGWTWLPQEIDSGNPPFLGWLIALAWQVFGQSLFIAHLVIWPFVLANMLLLARLGTYLAPKDWAWLPLIMLANPVYAAQTTLTSPDVLLLTAILLVWVGRLRTSGWWMMAGAILMGLTSLRGGVILGGIALWWLVDRRHQPFLKWLLIGGMAGLSYHLAHWWALGWAFLPGQSPWAGGFAWHGFTAIPRQVAILIWRLLDHGQLFLWAGLVYLVWRQPHRSSLYQAGAWLILFLLMISPFFIFFDHLNMHRYLLPVGLAASALLVTSMKERRWLSVLVAAGLFSGNFWIYPDGVAKGWDATLAWLAYPQHREEVLDCMDTQGIPWDQTVSAFPNLGPEKEILLNGEKRSFLDRADGLDGRYVLYSNVFNDFSDEEIARLATWTVRCRSGHWPVRVILYEHPEHE